VTTMLLLLATALILPGTMLRGGSFHNHLVGIVAEALAKIGNRRAVGPLIDFLENTTGEDAMKYREWVVTSLEKLSGQKYGNDIVRWRQWYEGK